LAAVEEVAGAVEDVLLLLDPPHALRTSATVVALMARKVVYRMASVAPIDHGRLGILRKRTRHRASTFPTSASSAGPSGWSQAARELVDPHLGT
jgi:hypothetical protein